MAVKTCKECSKEIEVTDEKCRHCGSDQRHFSQKHPIISCALVLISGLIIFGIINSMIESRLTYGKTVVSTDVVSNIPDDNNTTMNKAEFDQIQNGMSYAEVVQITGCEGEVISAAGTDGDQFRTIMYKWKGHGGFGANSNAMFQGGKLISKSQLGLE